MIKRTFHIKKILIPHDFSETADLALEHATFMARLMRAEITLLHVVESYSFASSITSAFSKTQIEYETQMESSSNQKLKEMADKIHRTTSMPVNFFTVKGKIYKSICDVAKEKDMDVIIMGTHGTGGVEEHNVGSNASKIATSSPVPVISVQAHAKKVGFHDIVLPIDNSSTSRQKVPLAIEIAKYYKSVIHVVGLNNLADPELAKRFDVKVHQVKDFVDEHEVPYTVTLLKGSRLLTPLMDYATQVKADMIVIMSDQESANAQQIVNQSKVPILTVHPSEGDPDKISVGY